MQSSLVESKSTFLIEFGLAFHLLIVNWLYFDSLWGNRLDRLEKSAKELSELTGRRCIPAQADVRQPKQLQEAAAKAIEAFGRIDFVICGESE